jgi:hypothetical protein
MTFGINIFIHYASNTKHNLISPKMNDYRVVIQAKSAISGEAIGMEHGGATDPN